MDPHKRSATIEVIDEQARVLAAGTYGTDKAGYGQILAAARKFADRVWAVEGCSTPAALRCHPHPASVPDLATVIAARAHLADFADLGQVGARPNSCRGL